MNLSWQVAKRVILLLMIPVVSGATLAATESSVGFYELNPQLPRLLRHALERRTAISKQPLAKHVP